VVRFAALRLYLGRVPGGGSPAPAQVTCVCPAPDLSALQQVLREFVRAPECPALPAADWAVAITLGATIGLACGVLLGVVLASRLRSQTGRAHLPTPPPSSRKLGNLRRLVEGEPAALNW
jgi:hypothetical protein